MSDWNAVLYRGVVGRTTKYTLRGEQTMTVSAMVARLEAAAGGRNAAARLSGVPRSSFGRIARGAKPTAANVDLLRLAVRRVRLSEVRETFLRAQPIVGAHVELTVSKDVRDRVIQVDRWATDKTFVNRIVDAWLATDDGGALEELLHPITMADGMPNGVQVTDLYEVRFFRTLRQFNEWKRWL